MPQSQLLVCPACRGPVTGEDSHSCIQCGKSYPTHNGDMVSFLGADAGTALDDIDYDVVYQVDAGASDNLYRQCRLFLGDLMPEHVSSYLEIGAGTGLFTLAFLSDARPERALITDVSAKMLEICRQRLTSRCVGQHTELSFALWDGSTNCFRDQAFDLVAGFSVLHHILDYPSVLAILRDTLTEDGRAVFLEPSLAFHRAIIDFMVDVVDSIPLGNGDWTDEHRSIVACWIGENYINVKFHGDGLALALREDKHLFDIASLRLAAADAGFGEARIIPFGSDNEAWITLGVYINQFSLPAATRVFLLEQCARRLPGPFVYLAPEESAPSFLIVLDRKGPLRREQLCGSVLPEISFKHPDPLFRFALDTTIERSDRDADMVRVVALGWLIGDIDVREVRFEGSGSARFPVGAIRLDVERSMNGDRRNPTQRALCCGIMEVPDQYLSHSPGSRLRVVVIAMCGERFELGWIEPGEYTSHFESLQAIRLPRAVAGG